MQENYTSAADPALVAPDAPATFPSDSGDLARAVELALRRLPLPAPPSLANLDTACVSDVTEIAQQLSTCVGVEARVRNLSPQELADMAADGHALLARLGNAGWLAASGRRARRIAAGREQRTPLHARALARLTGGQSIPTIVLQPQLGLESLSRVSLGSASPWARLRAFMALERSELLALVLYAVVIGGASLAVPIAVQVLVNTIALGSLLQPLFVLAMLLLAALTISGVISVFESYAVEVLQRRVFVRVAEDFARRLPATALAAHAHHNVRARALRFFEVVAIQKSIGKLLLGGLTLVLQTILGLLLMAFYHPLLLAFDVALLIALALIVALGHGAVGRAVDESAAKYRVAEFLQAVGAQPTLFNRAPGRLFSAQRADALTRDYLNARRLHFRRILRQLIGAAGVQVLALVALLGLGGFLVISGELTLGQLIAAELIVGTIVAGFAKLGRQFEAGYDLLASLDKLGGVLDLPVERVSHPTRARAGVHTGPLGFRLSGARLPSQRLLDLEVAAGQKVLLCGGSEHDRAHVLALLSGLGPALPGGGDVWSLGADRRPLGPAELRRRTLMLRPYQFVEGSVLDNLRVANPALSEELAQHMLARVQLTEAVARLPSGLHSPLLPSGTPFTQGELARLALARALTAQPDLLLVDIALDHLGLPERDLAPLLDLVFAADAPWSAVIVSEHPGVRARCQRSIHLEPPS